MAAGVITLANVSYVASSTWHVLNAHGMSPFRIKVNGNFSLEMGSLKEGLSRPWLEGML